MRPSSPSEVLRAAGVPALLVTGLTNIRYLTGMVVSAGHVLVTPRRFLLFVDSRYGFLLESSVREGTLVRNASELPGMLQKLSETGFEADELTVLRLQQWKRKFKNTKFIQTSGIIEEFRRSKDEEEVRCIRRARRITLELLRRVPSMLRRRITEEKLARWLLIWALELGADGLAFDPIVAFGTHTGTPHHHPTSRALRKGHIVQIDVGARVEGYCSDASEVYFTAPPTPFQKRVYRSISDAQKAAMRAVRAGVSTRELDSIARGILRRDGFEEAFCHSLGHGVGLEIHEGVTLSSESRDRMLLSNEVITIEPGVYFPGKCGMRVEDMIIVP